MKVWKTVGLVVGVMGFSAIGFGEPVFKFDGKSYSAGDLPPAMQQSHYELELEHFLKLQNFVDNAVIDLHVAELMKSKKKSREDIEGELFKVGEPTKKEVEQWYEENKSRLPPGYKLEQIEDNIKMVLKTEGQKEARAELVEKLKKSKGVSFLLTKPVAPQVKINTKGYPTKGPDSAAVTIVEFADYQCPHCKAAGPEIKKVMKSYGKKVRLVYMDYPINRSGISTKVAHGAYCADQQKKFWDFHELAFEKQRSLKDDSPAELAKESGLDMNAFEKCMKTSKPAEVVAAAKAEGERIGITGTPAIFVNGRRVHGYEEDELKEAIDAALKNASS